MKKPRSSGDRLRLSNMPTRIPTRRQPSAFAANVAGTLLAPARAAIREMPKRATEPNPPPRNTNKKLMPALYYEGATPRSSTPQQVDVLPAAARSQQLQARQPPGTRRIARLALCKYIGLL